MCIVSFPDPVFTSVWCVADITWKDRQTIFLEVVIQHFDGRPGRAIAPSVSRTVIVAHSSQSTRIRHCNLSEGVVNNYVELSVLRLRLIWMVPLTFTTLYACAMGVK